jgi:L-arabinose isomerase
MKELKHLVMAGANMMSDKGYGIGNEPDYLKFKAGRMLYTLVKYRDAGMSTYTYFWKNEQERVVSPFFDSEKEAYDWIKTQSEYE